MNKVFRLMRFDWPLHLVLLITNWLPDNVVLMKFRGSLARYFFLSAGKGLQIGRNVTFYNPSKIVIGQNVYFAYGVWLCANETIRIGNNVLFGPYSVVVTSNHSLRNGAYALGPQVKVLPVTIGSGAWIGAHSTILSGLNIADSTLVGANSLLNCDTEPLSIYGGVPAKILLKK